VARNPTRIGRYDLITALATGGMGRIYLGRASGLGGFERKVVIKTLEVPVSDESDAAIAMFLDEARLLGLLHHQHIASVFEVGRDDDGRHYIVLDYVEGYSAHDVWERALQFGAALPLDFSLTVVSAAANGLHYTHTRKDDAGTPLGIVHRDVTPSNVMIGHDGAVKLIDFGIAMAANRKTKTQTGFVKGKVGYLSPEQVGGRDVDARTDVFALGILLYELTTLQRAFRDTSDLATMQRIKQGKVARPSQLVGEYPLELEAIVMKALQVDPRDRFADADAMRRAVEALGHRLHYVLGDAAVIEVMSQLFDARAEAPPRAATRGDDAAFEWATSEHDLTVRRDPKELLEAMRAETARRDAEAATRPPPSPPIGRPRKLRAATEAADALIVDIASVSSTQLPLAAPPHTPIEIPKAAARRSEPGLAAAAEPPVAPMADPAAPPAIPANAMVGASLVAQHRQGSKLRWIGAASAVVVLGTVVVLVTRSPSSAVARSTPASTPVAARAPVPLPPPAKPAQPDPPPKPARIRLRIATHPSDATILLDSKKLGHTPFDDTVAADPGKHVMKLRRRGYTTQVLEVALDADVTEEITLQK
jgi:eukaryotic-like serine/threonine-protein kinase